MKKPVGNPFAYIESRRTTFCVLPLEFRILPSYRSSSAAMMFMLLSTAITSLILCPTTSFGKHW